MYRFSIILIFYTVTWRCAFAQNDSTQYHYADTMRTISLQEVVIIGEPSALNNSSKALSSLDSYLEKANAVNMVRRGSYAWEPLLNGMTSERSVVTIDGMRIYGACTDKMDPVTSYVEITNLAKANVHNGQTGSTGGATIAGSMDLVRNKGDFGSRSMSGMIFTGFEANNSQAIAGSSLSYSSPRFFTDGNITYRNAKNYRAGGGEEIQFSPFTKYNGSLITGYKIATHEQVEVSLIYDRAVDVGYPALPMDVSLAKAWISSVEYTRHHISPRIEEWQTKLYYNDVTHIMDDSNRPIVPIRMDMPGWSRTSGFYSRIRGNTGKHEWKANVSAHRNYSLAEMTMYPNTSGEKEMFMLTWPGVHTNYADIFVEDSYSISANWRAVGSMGIALHNNDVGSQFGLESLQIFYPEMERSQTRLLKRMTSSVWYETNMFQVNMGLAYGERAPSVSEGYGFYLFNSFDRFDYIGNPKMENEKSAEANVAVSFGSPRFTSKFSVAYFHLRDYIVGSPAPGLSVMTIGASGVKIYEQLKHAQIFNSTLDLGYRLTDLVQIKSKFLYRRGVGASVGNLPLIQPFTYTAGVTYSVKSFSTEATINGATRQNKFNADFGETPAGAYTVANLSTSKRFLFEQQSLVVKVGVENLFDTYYTTFADWNRLPRMGRNVFVNLLLNFW